MWVIAKDTAWELTLRESLRTSQVPPGSQSDPTGRVWWYWALFVRPIQPVIMNQLSHFDDHGASRMVDVGQKDVSVRKAAASGRVRMEASTQRLILDRKAAKGDVLEVARLAGIMAAKRTGELIPLCHVLPLDAVSISFDFPDDTTVAILVQAKATARTGVEMEALVAVSVTAMTIYDMCKSVDRSMVIDGIQLEEKSGGQSGRFVRKA
jgi:cyclic pyranopterin phosphate synthase